MSGKLLYNLNLNRASMQRVFLSCLRVFGEVFESVCEEMLAYSGDVLPIVSDMYFG